MDASSSDDKRAQWRSRARFYHWMGWVYTAGILVIAELLDNRWLVLAAVGIALVTALLQFTNSVVLSMPDDEFELFLENHDRLWRGLPMRRPPSDGAP